MKTENIEKLSEITKKIDELTDIIDTIVEEESEVPYTYGQDTTEVKKMYTAMSKLIDAKYRLYEIDIRITL